MSRHGTAWSVKGVDQATRDIAKRASQAAGLTIGEWIDQAIRAEADARAASGAPPQAGSTSPALPSTPPTGRVALSTVDALASRLDEAEARLDAAMRPIAYALQDVAERLVTLERRAATLPALPPMAEPSPEGEPDPSEPQTTGEEQVWRDLEDEPIQPAVPLHRRFLPEEPPADWEPEVPIARSELAHAAEAVRAEREARHRSEPEPEATWPSEPGAAGEDPLEEAAAADQGEPEPDRIDLWAAFAGSPFAEREPETAVDPAGIEEATADDQTDYEETGYDEVAYAQPGEELAEQAAEEPDYGETAFEEPVQEEAGEEPAEAPSYGETAFEEPVEEPVEEAGDEPVDEPAYGEVGFEEAPYEQPDAPDTLRFEPDDVPAAGEDRPGTGELDAFGGLDLVAAPPEGPDTVGPGPAAEEDEEPETEPEAAVDTADLAIPPHRPEPSPPAHDFPHDLAQLPEQASDATVPGWLARRPRAVEPADFEFDAGADREEADAEVPARRRWPWAVAAAIILVAGTAAGWWVATGGGAPTPGAIRERLAETGRSVREAAGDVRADAERWLVDLGWPERSARQAERPPVPPAAGEPPAESPPRIAREEAPRPPAGPPVEAPARTEAPTPEAPTAQAPAPAAPAPLPAAPPPAAPPAESRPTEARPAEPQPVRPSPSPEPPAVTARAPEAAAPPAAPEAAAPLPKPPTVALPRGQAPAAPAPAGSEPAAPTPSTEVAAPAASPEAPPARPADPRPITPLAPPLPSATRAADADSQVAALPPGQEAAGDLAAQARNGDPRAQYELAARLAQQAEPDYMQAANWFREAAIQGVPNAQYNLGVLYERGLGVPQDDTRALLWYHSAAEQGHPLAQYNLGVLYSAGRGIPLSYAEAARWFRRAAERGVPAAAFNLAVLTEGGLGVPRDAAEAERLLRQAAELGHPEAKRRIAAGGLGQEVTPLAETAATVTDEGVGEQDVAAIQTGLARLGLYDGPIDGIAGPKTREAISRFQAREGLPATGLPSASLRRLMENQPSG